MSNEITVYEGAPAPLTVGEIRSQVNLIQEIMREVMRKDEHYGVIPGTGTKPSLLKAGAEKLILTFRLVPDIEEQVIEMPHQHREYRVKVRLNSQNGIFLGAGVGSCSTMEGKYRFRTGPIEFTDMPVPKEYWNLRNSDPGKAKEIIKGYATKKNDAGQWMLAIAGEKVEHDNPADYYNTCLKMAKKRALVDACLTVTAASDIFTQDIEDMPEIFPAANRTPPTEAPKQEKPDKKPAPATVESSKKRQQDWNKEQAAKVTPGTVMDEVAYHAHLMKLINSIDPADILMAAGFEGTTAEFVKLYPTRQAVIDILRVKVQDKKSSNCMKCGEIRDDLVNGFCPKCTER